MDFFEKFKIKASKKTLFLLAGFLWGFAGWRVSSLGFIDLFTSSAFPYPYLIFSTAVFFVFYKFIFSNMVKKHRNRILKSKLQNHCIFSFFDVKSYCIMFFMIIGGISLRNAHIINPCILGSFYIGLGLALFSAGIMFLYSVLKYKEFETLYKSLKED